MTKLPHWPWQNFLPAEVLSPDGLVLLGSGQMLVSPKLLDTAEEFREFVGYPLVINGGTNKYRGYRSYRENRLVKGKSFSFHMQGLALDLHCPSLSLQDLYGHAVTFEKWSAVGFYPERGFIHVDLRPLLAGWERVFFTG